VLNHVFEGAHDAGLHTQPTVWTAIAIPFIAGFVWWTVRRIRKHHDTE
jgi:uncharacterized membrane-anchored protein